IFEALDRRGELLKKETFYSIGGGFVVTAEELNRPGEADSRSLPYPFDTAASMLQMARQSGKSIAEMKRANELQQHTVREVEEGIASIWAAMNACINRGLSRQGTLPGGLGVERRARSILHQIERERGTNQAQPRSEEHTSELQSRE